MAKRVKAEEFEVADADAAMSRFKSVLGKLMQVPKGEIKDKPKRKATRKRKA
jgi:hypothetical protein